MIEFWKSLFLAVFSQISMVHLQVGHLFYSVISVETDNTLILKSFFVDRLKTDTNRAADEVGSWSSGSSAGS